MKPVILSDKDKLKRIYKKFAVPSAVFALALCAVYFFAVKYGYDSRIGHFDGTVLFYLLVGLTAAAVLCGAVLSILGRGYTVLPGKTKSPLALIGRLISALSALALFVRFLTELFSRVRQFTLFEKIGGFMMIFVMAAMLLSIFDGAFGKNITAVTFVLAALALNFTIFSHYFDFSVPINSPQRNLSTVMYCAALLLMISEARFCLPEKSERSSASFMIFVNFVTVAVCAGFPVGIIAYRLISGAQPDGTPDILWLVLFIGVALVALSRLMQSDMIYTEKTKKESKGNENG